MKTKSQNIAIGIDGGETGFALRANASHSGDKGDGGVNTTFVAVQETAHSLKAEGFDASEDGIGSGVPLAPEVCSAVTSKWAKSSGGPSGDECQNLVPVNHGRTRQGGFFDDGIGNIEHSAPRGAQSDAEHRSGDAVIAFSSKDHGADAGEVAPTIRSCNESKSHASGGGPPAIAFPARMSATQCAKSENVSCAIGSANPTAIGTFMAVRRLTPRACERLQGFPDDFTLVQHNGKPAADGPRYKAIGNSMAVPNIEWILRRMDLVDELVPWAETDLPAVADRALQK